VRAARPLLAGLAALALAPASASAHAQLEGTTPARGAHLARAPAEVGLRFGEAVEVSFGAVRVYDARGREVQSGTARHPGGHSNQVAVKLKPGLGDGGYTVTYRVISADSHPVSGGFVFSVGNGAAPAATVDELLAGGDAGPVTSVAFGTARAVQYAAIAVAIGALAFLLWAWLPALRAVGGGAAAWQSASVAFAARLRALLAASAAAGVLSAAAGIVLQGATAGGTSAWAALDPTVVGDVLATRFGLVWGLALLAWAWAGVAALALGSQLPTFRPASVGATGLALRAPARPTLAVLGLPVAALALLPGLGGHAAAEPPVALNLPANVLHVLAVGAWLGGIVVLVAVLRHATGRLEGADRTRLLAATVARFSTLAGVAVAVILTTGVVQGLLSIGAVSQLVDTAYGRAVLVKLVLLAGIIVLGWRNRSRHLPDLHAAAAGGTEPGRAGVALRRALRAELAIAAVVLGTTGALAGYPPAEAVSAGPFSTDKPIGPARLEVTVEPARVGPNEVHLYLFNRRDGRQFDRTKELTIRASLPGRRIAPIELQPRRAGPGHYVVTDAAFGLKGDWRVEVAARVSISTSTARP
jgi:copper transport protein